MAIELLHKGVRKNPDNTYTGYVSHTIRKAIIATYSDNIKRLNVIDADYDAQKKVDDLQQV